MNALDIGQKMVAAVNGGRESEWQFVTDFYADDIVSIEGAGSEEMPARTEGMDAIRAKHEWWYGNNEIHGVRVEGPYKGLREDQFALHFEMDATPRDGERMQMKEVAIYTVADDRIVQEEYLYLMG